MNHLVTARAGDELRLLYQDLSQHRPSQAPGLDRVRRTALGLSFPDAEAGRKSYGYCCVVAERCFWSRDDGKAPERQYVVVDEGGATSLFDLAGEAVILKDKYLSDFVGCPNAPSSAVEGLRRWEGLTHYPVDEPAQALRHKYSTFVSQETTASIRETELPTVGAMVSDLNLLWNRDLQHPDDSLPIFGSAVPVPLKTLYVLGSSSEANYTTSVVAQGIAANEERVTTALWLAVKGLEATLWAGRSGQEDPRDWMVDPRGQVDSRNITGY